MPPLACWPPKAAELPAVELPGVGFSLPHLPPPAAVAGAAAVEGLRRSQPLLGRRAKKVTTATTTAGRCGRRGGWVFFERKACAATGEAC